jgi:hypothetical protein
MSWVEMPKEQPCAICGTAVELWVVLKSAGRKVAEATFCPICYPNIHKIFAVPEKERGSARDKGYRAVMR